MNDITKKIESLRLERGWSVYKLAQESGLPAPTIRKWLQKEMFPSIPALMQICEAFNISLSEFFAKNDLVELNPKIKELYDDLRTLPPDEQAAITTIIKSIKRYKQ